MKSVVNDNRMTKTESLEEKRVQVRELLRLKPCRLHPLAVRLGCDDNSLGIFLKGMADVYEEDDGVLRVYD